MKKWLKNSISILLSAILILSVFTAFPFSAYAAEDEAVEIAANDSSKGVGYSQRTAPPPTSSQYYYNSSYNPFYSARLVTQCTWYAWGRAYEIMGKRPNFSTGHAYNWYSYNANNGIYDYSSNYYAAREGAVMCFGNGSYGHVAIVEEVGSNGAPTKISEGGWTGSANYTANFNYADGYYGEQLKFHYGANYTSNFQGYIYIAGQVPPTNAWITVSSTSIPVGNSIYFNYGADGATYPFTIGIDRNGSRYITEDNWAGKSFTFNEAGDYSAFITAWNDSGYCNSERVYFKVIPQGHVMTDAEGAGQTIPDGDYWICSRISQTYYLDIEGDNFNTKNGDNLTTHIWESQNPYNLLLPGKWDAFHLKYLNNGFYQITQYNTQMAIDVDGVSVNCGTNVQMWEVNNSYAQQWSIEKTDKGYKLRARCSAFYMDIDGDVLCNGTNVHTWDGWDGNCQLFSFIPYAPDERPIADGIYTINSSLGNTCYLDVAGVPGEFTKKSNVQIWNGSNPDEKFRFEYVGNGYYRIYEATSNYSVEIINEESYLDKNKNAILYEKNNSRGQFWKIKKNADGTVSLINALSGYYLDVFDGKTDNGTNVHSHPYNNSNAQKWNLRRVLNPEMVTVKSWNWVNGVMKPSVEVTVDNNKLIEGTDYTITSYINNDNFLGKISGIGNYCNSVSVEYNNEPIVGDLNGDNSVDVLDATIVQKHASGKADLTDEQRAIADVNNDEVADILDAAEIQKFAAGKITEFKKKA